jgi:hypothetical protein
MAEQLHLHKCCATFKRFKVSLQSSHTKKTIASRRRLQLQLSAALAL